MTLNPDQEDAGSAFVEEYESRIGRQLEDREKGVLAEMANTLCDLAGSIAYKNSDQTLATMTNEDLADIIAERQKAVGAKFFLSYEDDEDMDDVYFHTNMNAEEFGLMVETFEINREEIDEDE